MIQETLEYLGIAFISSVLLIIMSKIILQAVIRRPADYYNARELEEEEIMLNSGGISITMEHETTPEGEVIEDTHLDAHLGDMETPEPEKIIEEVPASVHESIEVQEFTEDADTEELAPLYNEGETDLYSEDEIFEPDESIFTVSDGPDDIEFETETVEDAESAEEVAEEEPAAEEPVAEEVREEEPATEEPVAEEVTEEEPATEEPVAEEVTEEEPAAEEPVAEEVTEEEPAAEDLEAEELVEEEPAAEEPVVEEIPEEEPAAEEPEAEEVPEEEPAAEDLEAEELVEEEPAAEEPVAEDKQPETPEKVFGFSIKAKTSKVKAPKRHEEEEAAEELELAKAAMEEARNKESADKFRTPEPVSEWTESYSEIRDSLEKAFNEHMKKPSMRMNKKQLTEIAESLGIDIPEKATKKVILDLINSVSQSADTDSQQ